MRGRYGMVFLVMVLGVWACESKPEPPDKAKGEAASGSEVPESREVVLPAIEREHAEAGKTPEGALKMWMRYAAVYHKEPFSSRVALEYLTLPYKDNPQWHTLSSARTFVERLEKKPYIFQSYAVGSSPENGYAFNPETFELAVEKSGPDQHGDRGHAVFLRSSGADSPRPVYLKKSTKTGLYYVSIHANTYVDIRPPVDPDKETFE